MHAEDDDQDDSREEGGDGITHHRDEGSDLIENRILLVGGEDPYRNRNEKTHQVGQTHHPERLGQSLHDEVHGRSARGPRANPETLGGVTDCNPRPPFEEIERFVDDELLEPLEVTKVKRLAESQALTDFLAYLRGNGQGHLARWISRREIQEGEYDETDDQQGGNGKQQPPDRITQHECKMERIFKEALVRHCENTLTVIHTRESTGFSFQAKTRHPGGSP